MLAVGRALMSDPKHIDAGRAVAGAGAGGRRVQCTKTFGHLHREGLTILLAEQSIELALEVSELRGPCLQVGKSVLSGTAAALAQDPQCKRLSSGLETRTLVGW